MVSGQSLQTPGADMTQSVLSTVAETTSPAARIDLPSIPSWAIPRRSLADRLDVGMSGLLTVVTGPTGAGKTMGVASWASGADLSGGVIWLNLSRGGADPDSVWRHLQGRWIEAGAGDLPPVPSRKCSEPKRIGMLADFGEALRAGGPWVVVLDDYPSGSPGRLERELDVVLDHARRAVRLVVISQGTPALDVHRHSVAGELTRVAGRDLAMDAHDVAEVLRSHRVDATEATVRIVERHTAGWACGVRQAAVSMRDAPTMAAAMKDTDRAVADYLAREVLDQVPTSVRELIMRTSIVDDVSPDLATAILGAEVAAPAALFDARNAFIDFRDDGSFRCHPLLRATALARLSLEQPELAREARRRAARWYVEHDEADRRPQAGYGGRRLAVGGEGAGRVACSAAHPGRRRR